MTDPYRRTPAPGTYVDPNAETIGKPLPVVTRSGVARTLLWVVLVISVVGNMVASYTASTPLHLACGAVTALCLTALIVQGLRGRR
ncbi:hypothetical protein [Streptomyces flaveus]|uniref:hypothetical protein n=1 Tax=Streptomyces flaveus TaxID=66370 RepID=UPI003324A6E3